MEKRLTKEQENLRIEIMEKNDSQRKVDKIVEETKFAMESSNQEIQQAKVDKIFENQLSQKCNSKTPANE